MPKYRTTTFSSVSDIDAFFQKLGSKGFADWFNTKIAEKDNWLTVSNGKVTGVKLKNPSNWNKFWSNYKIIYGRDNINLIEFLCLDSIVMNENGGLFSPVTEGVNDIGSSGHPGIAYAFDSIPGTKVSYNTLDTNKKSLDLFSDSTYILAHGSKPFGSILKNTTNTAWSGTVFPTGFATPTPSSKAVDPSGIPNTFITEADFFKFRGRGFVQTTGRGAYKPIISYVLSYTGNDSVILNVKKNWSQYGGNLDKIASASTNTQWDDLFQKTNSIVANYAVYVHNKSGGAYAKKGIDYLYIDPSQSDNNLKDAIRKVALAIAGKGAKKYADLFYARVMQQLTLIEGTEAGPIPPSSTPTGATSSQTPQQAQEEGREARTGNDINSNQNKPKNLDGKILTNVNIFPATIKPNPIVMPLPSGEDAQDEIVQGLGNIPFIWYNSYQIEYNDIRFFNLSIQEHLPTVKIIFFDSLNLMKDKAFPLDDSKIEVFINARSEQVKPIFLQFKITKFSINGSEYSISGVLDVNYLYLKTFKSYNSTSFYALQSICKESGLGFNSNFDDTNDSMKWLNTGQRSIEFIESIVETSYKSDQSFLYFYIDYYYNLNYIDIEKELSRNIKEDLGIGNIGIEDALKTSNPEIVSKLFLTNDLSMAESNIFFESYKVLNNSTATSIKEGYKTKMKYYDEKAKSFLIFDVGSITDTDQKSIILKGAPNDESFYNDNTQYLYTGRIDTDNTHQNYHYSYVQNTRNLVDLQKVGLEIVMKTPNFNIYRFQKVFLFLSNQISTPSAPQINNRLTGEWLIVDISYNYDGKSFRQVVKLLKRELELSPEELAKEPTQNQPAQNTGGEKTSNDNGVINENPVVSATQSTTPGATSSTPIDDTQFPLTKDIFRELYKARPKIVELWYEPLKNALIRNGITSKERIAAFLSQVSIESGFIFYTTERGISAGSQYEARKDLGNTKTGDGVKYKGRGLLQITGRNNYSKASQYFNQDFVNDTSLLSAENPVHQRYADTPEQIQNAINASVWFWLKGSVRGDLNKYADKMDIKKPFNFGGTTIEDLPENVEQSKKAVKKYGIFTTKNPNDIATHFSPNDTNFVNFTMICLGINGGYNGFQSRCKNWLQIREYFK